MSEDEAHFWCHDVHERLSDWYRHGCPDDEAAAIKRHVTAQIRREVVEAIVERAATSSHLHDEILLIQEFVRFWLAEQKANE